MSAVSRDYHAEATQWLDQKISLLCQWIEAHLLFFLPASQPYSSDLLFERFKPIGELALGLFVLAAPIQRQSSKPLRTWAERLAHQLAPEIEHEAAGLNWEILEQQSITSPFTALSLLAYLVLETVTGNTLQCQARLERLLCCSHANLPMEFYFLSVLLGQGRKDAILTDRLKHIITVINNAEQCSSSVLYDLTHAVFYLTLFGQHTPLMLDVCVARLHALLGELTLCRLQACDFDLGAELLMCQMYTGRSPDYLFNQAVRRLLEAVPEDGCISAPAYALHANMNQFEKSYHTTLVVLLALAEVRASPTRQ